MGEDTHVLDRRAREFTLRIGRVDLEHIAMGIFVVILSSWRGPFDVVSSQANQVPQGVAPPAQFERVPDDMTKLSITLWLASTTMATVPPIPSESYGLMTGTAMMRGSSLVHT